MVKIEVHDRTLEVSRREHSVLLEIKDSANRMVEVITLTPTESEALENALRIYRREAERRAR